MVRGVLVADARYHGHFWFGTSLVFLRPSIGSLLRGDLISGGPREENFTRGSQARATSRVFLTTIPWFGR
jgi:hypothetical protein